MENWKTVSVLGNDREAALMGYEEQINEIQQLKDKIKRLIIRSEGTIYFIPYEEIFFIEKIERKSVIHTRYKLFETNETLGSLSTRLDIRFVQTHRSYIVNFEHVFSIKSIGDSYRVSIRNYDAKAYISKNKMQIINRLLEEDDRL